MRREGPRFARVTLPVASLLLLHFLVFDGGNRSRYDFDVALASQALATVTIGAWLASLLVLPRAFPRTILDGPIATYLLATLVSLAFAQDRRVSLEAVAPVIGGVLLFYLLVDLWRLGLGRRLAGAVAIAGTSAAALSLVEIGAWYLGALPTGLGTGEGSWLPLARELGWLPPVIHRATYAANANHLAALIALALPFLVVPVLVGPGRRARWIAAAGVIGLAPPLLLTFSRGGLLAAAVGVGVASVLAPRAGPTASPAKAWHGSGPPRRRPSPWLTTLLAGVLVIGAGLLPRDRLSAFLRPETLANRFPVWGPAIDLWGRHPLTGVGPGGFGLALAGYSDRSPDHVVVQLAHNGVLHLAAELGLAGLAATGWLVWTVGRVWRDTWQKAGREERRRLAAIAGALTAFLSANVFDAYFTFQLVMIPLTLIVAALVAPICPPRPGISTDAMRRDRAIVGLLTLLGVAAVVVTVYIDRGWAAFAAARQAAADGHWTEAERSLAEAAALDPAFPFYARQLGLVRGFLAEAADSPADRSRRAATAIAAYEQGRSQAQPVDLLNEARARELAGSLPEALALGRTAVERDPWDPVLLLNWGRWLESAGDLPAAVDAYARAVAQAPAARRSAYWHESEARRRLLPQIDDRVQDVLAADTTIDRSEARRRQAEAAAAAGDPARARDVLSGLSPTDPRGLLVRGRLAELAADDTTALTAHEQAFRRVPAQDEFLIARIAASYAASLARTGETGRAEQMIGLARFYLVDPEIEDRTAQVARARGQVERALRAYEASLATVRPIQERFAPNALARPAIFPPTLPGLIQPEPSRDVEERRRELDAYRAGLGLGPVPREDVSGSTARP